jgi:hypothetical protein
MNLTDPYGSIRADVRREAILHEIANERQRQRIKWTVAHAWGHGDCSSDGVDDAVKMAVLTEEVGEVARALLDRKPADLRAELVQVAAVAVAWVEALDATT